MHEVNLISVYESLKLIFKNFEDGSHLTLDSFGHSLGNQKTLKIFTFNHLRISYDILEFEALGNASGQYLAKFRRAGVSIAI